MSEPQPTNNQLYSKVEYTPEELQAFKEEQIAELFWKLDRKNRRKVLNKSAKWKAYVYKVISNKYKEDQRGDGAGE